MSITLTIIEYVEALRGRCGCLKTTEFQDMEGFNKRHKLLSLIDAHKKPDFLSKVNMSVLLRH
jgi:hypothetical protein